MTPVRMLQVYSLLAVFLAGHAVAIIKTKELWPFSRYPMYARPSRSAVFNQVLLFGLGKKGKEFPITARQLKIAAPMLRKQLASLERDNKRRPERVRQRLGEYITWYKSKGGEKQRRTPLTGVRVYKLEYPLSASGVKAKKPNSRVLIAEFIIPKAAGSTTMQATTQSARTATRESATKSATKGATRVRGKQQGGKP